MHCPFCQAEETKVVDSRLVSAGNQVRRRRECLRCSDRFTTYESAEMIMPRVIKSDGSRVPFDERKLKSGIHKALEKRPVSIEAVEAVIQGIIQQLYSTGEREINAEYIGGLVMNALRSLDQVAYVRFASVYRSFEDVEAFHKEIQRLRGDDNKKSKVKE